MKKTYIQPTVKVRVAESQDSFMAGSLANVTSTGLGDLTNMEDELQKSDQKIGVWDAY